MPEPVKPATTPVARIGVRTAVSKPGGTKPARRSSIDPAEFRCARLAGELADEWVAWAHLYEPSPGWLSGARTAVRGFAAFADAHADAAEALSLASPGPEVALLLREWRRTLPSGYPQGSTSPYHHDNHLSRLVRLRAGREGAVTGEPVRQVVSGYSSVRAGKTTELDEFTRQEKAALVRAGWAGVIEAEHRLERGRKLLEQAAGDPAVHGWQDPANLLWFLHRGGQPGEIRRLLPHSNQWPRELAEIAEIAPHRKNPHHGLLRSLVALLYPHNADLQAFRVLMAAATGMVDEIGALTEADVEFTPAGVVLDLVKRRAHGQRRRRFADRGQPSPVQVVHRLLTLTEPVRARCAVSPASLFTFAHVATDYSLTFPANRPGGQVSSFPRWARARGVVLAGKQDIRRIRKAVKVERIIAVKGSVAQAADDHTEATFLSHYAGGSAMRVISGQIVTEAQQEWLERAMIAPRILDQATVDRLEESEVQARLGLNPETAAQLGAGALNMGVSDCQDPYNPPHGTAGQLCAVAPLHCLECGNALILPSSLPQLLLMGDHLEVMRRRLAPPLFASLWAQRQANLRAALAERTPAEIEGARRRIAELDLRLQLPLAARTEFDL